jgi:hypothetical protein
VTTVRVVDARPSNSRQRWTSRPVGRRFAADDCVALAGPTAVAVFPVPVRLTVLLLLLTLDSLRVLVLVTVVAITWSGTRNPPLIYVRPCDDDGWMIIHTNFGYRFIRIRKTIQIIIMGKKM